MPLKTKIYIALVLALGLTATGIAGANWSSVASPGRMALYVALTALASLVKLRLPGLEGTYSLNAVFLLAGAVHFTLTETVAAAIAGVLVQSLVLTEKRPSAIQLLFNLANESFSIAVACGALSYLVREEILPFRPALLATAAAIYFVLNTGLVSGILTFLGGGEFLEVNRQWYSWSFPYYLLGAALVGVLPLDGRPVDIEACAVLVPLAYLIHFFGGLAERRREDAAVEVQGPTAIPASAKQLTAAIAALAVSFAVFASSLGESTQLAWFGSYLILAILTATWKVKLPATPGTISVHYVVMLVAVAQGSMIEALAISAAGPLVQSLWRVSKRPQPIQILFNVATMVVATGITFWMCRILPGPDGRTPLVALLAGAAVLHFLTNTMLVAAVISLVEREPVVALWRRLYFWTFPIYMVGATAAAMMVATARAAGWVPSLFILPLMAMIQYSFRFQLGQFDVVKEAR